MNYLKMLKEICKLVESEFCHDMSERFIQLKRGFTQEEAKEMAKIIGKVYLIAHGIHCESCGLKYVTDKE